jgi:hypothetical protein
VAWEEVLAQWDQWVEQEIYSQLPQKVQQEQELLAALPSEVLLNLEALEQVLAVQLEGYLEVEHQWVVLPPLMILITFLLILLK